MSRKRTKGFYTIIVPIAVVALIFVLGWSYWNATRSNQPAANQEETANTKVRKAPAKQPTGRMIIDQKIENGFADIIFASPKIFAYAHGTVVADNRFFVGMASKSENHFPTNEMAIFGDPSDISRYVLTTLPKPGDIETMVYDPGSDKVYFALSGDGTFGLYSIDPHRYALSTILSTTSLDTGRRPAIVTDGRYIYGITDTDPSTVFRVEITTGILITSSKGHIANGHSAAIGIFASSTELYFGGGMSDGFEKVDAADLHSMAKLDLGPCSMSDDMPYVKTGERGGYVYVGCESVPEGKRVSTEDMSVTRFPLPGRSLGMFVFGNDLFNCAVDGIIDVFPNFSIEDLKRYLITNKGKPFTENGQAVEPNELLYSTTTNSLYFTAWWGTKGLYQVSTTTVVK